MKERNTRQKEIIYDILCSSNNHPTVKELCDEINMKGYHIGQATVYRNVSKLVSLGKIKKFSTVDGVEHYDANCAFHAHFVCNCCHKIYDVDDVCYDNIIAQSDKRFCVSAVSVTLEGTCNLCQEIIDK